MKKKTKLKTGAGALIAAIVAALIILPGTNQQPCIDTLAGATFGKELRAIPNEFSIGLFLEAFTKPEKAFKVIKKELAVGRSHIRVNLLWKDDHKYGSKEDVAFITKWSKKLDVLCVKHGPRIQISPFTEHNLSDPDRFLSIVKANAPNCGKPVNSVWKGAFTRNANYENEVHGEKSCDYSLPAACSYSYDGLNATNDNFVNRRKAFSKSPRFCSWAPWDNLRYSDKDTTSRPQRIKEAKQRKPSKDLLLSEVYLFTDPGVIDHPNNWLIKSHAENHGANDPKGNKLLILSPLKANKISLKRNGKDICDLNYYGKFDGGGYRYYADTMGFKYGANLDMYIGNKRFGTINGGFRSGKVP